MKIRMPIMKRAVLLLAILLLYSPVFCKSASGEWLMFTTEDVPEDQGFLVQEYTGTVRMTFLGDCTLGSERKVVPAYRGFVKTIERNGYEWPFRNLKTLTAVDDLTVVNLEGVLSDRELARVQKDFNFMGSTAYTKILKSGSVECVSLANNHTHDYDRAGYEDTKHALDAAGVAYFSTDCMAVWRNEEGLMIGFLGVYGSVTGNRGKSYEQRAEILRSLGCAAVITVMHAGTEYESQPSASQNLIADKALECGSCLVIGHHPHIVQGYEIRKGMPVVFSLGNCVFGGNVNPPDHDALAVQAELSFQEGELTATALRFYPITVSGESGWNDYSPVLLDGEDAERVLNKMKDSTGVSPGAFDRTGGAVVTVPAE